MQLNTDLTGLFGILLAIFAMFVRVPRLQAFPLRLRVAVLAAALIVLLIPVWGVSLTGFCARHHWRPEYLHLGVAGGGRSALGIRIWPG